MEEDAPVASSAIGLEQLGRHCTDEILSLLPAADVLRMRTVSRAWKGIAEEFFLTRSRKEEEEIERDILE